ncbi:MAG: alanine--glyoxylate aminotransferase family protein [Solirubrobacteraceae bacterium]
MQQEPSFTLTAGPVIASDRVREALGAQIVYDYDVPFLDRFRRTQEKVAQLFGTQSDVVLMQGEAVLGLEAATRGIVTADTTCLNLVSGVYSKWFGEKLRTLGPKKVIDIEVPFDSAIDPEAVEGAFRDHPEIGMVSVTHCETPSGTLNPIDEIGQIARAHGAMTICDAVSSLGGEPVRVDEWGLDLCVSAPQKCLGAAPGLSMVTVSERAWEVMRGNPNAPRRSYLSLLDWKERWEEQGQYPYTPSVTDVTGLEAACDEILEEGIDQSIERHRHAARACRAGVRAAGLEVWPRTEEIAASCVTAVKVPEGVDEAELRRVTRDRSGVIISGAQGDLVGKVVRIGHMGVVSRSLYPLIGVVAVADAVRELGVPVDLGAAAEAVVAALSEGVSAQA